MKSLIRLTIQFSTKNKIPRPRDPTMAQSFETKLSQRQMKILLDPRGFMTEEEKANAEQNKTQNLTGTTNQANAPTQPKNLNGVEPEYGYKPKGPEPTRYGDWQVKGKCVDF